MQSKSNWINKVWGCEEVLCNTDKYAGKILHLDKGAQCSYHCHAVKHETFYVLSGTVEFVIGEVRMVLTHGDVAEIPVGVYHSFKGLEDSQIIEISTHDSASDNYRMNKSTPGMPE